KIDGITRKENVDILKHHLKTSVRKLKLVAVVHSSSTSISTLQSYRPVVNDYGPSLGFSQVKTNCQIKYAELLAIIEETKARYVLALPIHVLELIRECLAEIERNARP
uniref:Uncharacterized protein n=1 Tax=Hucho hucho TaxID=62062 RepID=A0A4W5NDD0_9TELE